MRVVALGGAGDMGRYAVRTAVKYDFVDELAPLCSPAFGSGREMLAVAESGGDNAAGDAA